MGIRLKTLKARREKLINANDVNHYTRTDNPKIEKYFRCLLSIKKEINEIECINTTGMQQMVFTVKDLRNLTQPK